MKRLVSLLMAAALTVGLTAAAGAADVPSQKEEVVYGILDTDGSVENVYVVNIFKGARSRLRQLFQGKTTSQPQKRSNKTVTGSPSTARQTNCIIRGRWIRTTAMDT